jgi:hypothetical protein
MSNNFLKNDKIQVIFTKTKTETIRHFSYTISDIIVPDYP